MELEVVKLSEAKRGFVLLPSAGWWSAVRAGWRGFGDWRGIMNSWQRRSKGLHVVAFAMLMLKQLTTLIL